MWELCLLRNPRWIFDVIAEGGVDGGSNVLMAKKKEVKELVKKWRVLNWMRMMMPLVGTVMGLWTALNETSVFTPLV